MNYSTLFSAKGRIGRKTYWLTAITLMVVMMVAWGIAGGLAIATAPGDGSMGGLGILLFIVAGLISLVGLWSFIALAFKRCHDRDMSGWMMLIPFYNMWVSIQMYFLPGTAGPNRFGPDPLGHLSLSYAAA